MKSKFFASAVVLFIAAIFTGGAFAQGLPAMGVPIPTTMVLTKPAPGQSFGDKQVVTVGIGDKTYKFILKDAFVNHRFVRWPDIWQSVRQFNPNFVAQGIDQERFAKIEPGQTVTINGVFAPLNRTFEVMSVDQAKDQGSY